MNGPVNGPVSRPETSNDIERVRRRRLFVGVVLCWLAPNAIFTAFMSVAELRPPFDTVVAVDPAFVIYALVGALLAGWTLSWRYAALAEAARSGADRDLLRQRIKWLFASLPLVVSLYVAGGAIIMVAGISDLALWSAADLAVAAALASMTVLQILVPLGILCLDEFGVAFGQLVSRTPVLPGFLRSLPVLLLALMIGMLQPLYEYARLGEISLASWVLFGLLVPYAIAVTLLNLRYSEDALTSAFRFLGAARPEQALVPEQLQPRSLDDYGVLIAQIRELVAHLQTTRDRLETSEQRLRTFAEAASDWFYEIDADLRFVWVSDRIVDSVGIRAEELVGLVVGELAERYPSSDWDRVVSRLTRREPFRSLQISLGDELPVHLELSAVPLFDGEGRFRGYRGTGSDVTERVTAQRSLRERETQLAQAQKMEAVGQLTGGIAHDFNNLLTAVAGSLELLRVRRAELADERLVSEALTASRRAGDLVQRLLAFSRRQALRPEVVDVGAQLEDMAELLARTLGPKIELTVDVDRSRPRAHVDPAQLESAVLNLAINARDAMEGTGRLRLGAHAMHFEGPDPELAPGDYVRVSVEDTGSGIPEDVLPHVFEPFFSTKADGQGSGLGLSMVYGFVRQSGGGLRLESREGEGTRMEMLLPRAEDAAAVSASTGTHQAMALRADATVLVVEDEPSVLGVVREALELVGCNVLHSATGDEAVLELEKDTRIDLLLSDVVMPGTLSGVDVVRRGRELRPEMRCVLMSGYAREHLSDADDLADVPMLAKPFRLEELIRLVTGVLGPGS